MDIILSFLAKSVDKHSITLVHITYPPLSNRNRNQSKMIKSDEEMKNNGIHHSNLSNATFANIFPGLAVLSERERYTLERI